MKNKVYIAGLLLMVATALPSCKKLGEVDFEHKFTFDMQINPVTPGEYTYGDIVVMNDVEASLQDYGASLDLLKSMKLTAFEVRVYAPDGATFDPFDRLEVYIGSGTLGNKLVASINPVPQGQIFLAFDAEDVELRDYFMEDEIRFLVTGYNGQATTTVTSIKVDVFLKVIADLI
jgi:hypothetical protein